MLLLSLFLRSETACILSQSRSLLFAILNLCPQTVEAACVAFVVSSAMSSCFD